MPIRCFMTVCPETMSPYIVTGTLAGGVFLIGVLLLITWKVAIVLYDRQQVRRFEEEVNSAAWQNTVRQINILDYYTNIILINKEHNMHSLIYF